MTRPTITGLTLALLLLVGCGTDPVTERVERDRPEPTTTEAPATTSTTTTEAPSADELVDQLPRDVILDTLIAEEPWFSTVPRSTTVELIAATCEAMGMGTSVELIVLTGLESGVPESATGSMLAAAVVGWCPEHSDLLDDFMGTWG